LCVSIAIPALCPYASLTQAAREKFRHLAKIQTETLPVSAVDGDAPSANSQCLQNLKIWKNLGKFMGDEGTPRPYMIFASPCRLPARKRMLIVPLMHVGAT
jgi:hypothetical protein